jgi:hypothetical protein
MMGRVPWRQQAALPNSAQPRHITHMLLKLQVRVKLLSAVQPCIIIESDCGVAVEAL